MRIRPTFPWICLGLGLAAFGAAYEVLGQEPNRDAQAEEALKGLIHQLPHAGHPDDFLFQLLGKMRYASGKGASVCMFVRKQSYLEMTSLLDRQGVVTERGWGDISFEAKPGWKVSQARVSGTMSRIDSRTMGTNEGKATTALIKDRFSEGQKAYPHAYNGLVGAGKIEVDCQAMSPEMVKKHGPAPRTYRWYWSLFRRTDPNSPNPSAKQ